ncbi:hypothetical protein HYALB_00001757 [Hymenoscyphus albidus]|uniref:Uncharacterized protein n=1 Tax=Hymenoscyphus albidus TaxID=595503 RepID=A0A9N9Q335_9HELO|nr:hypothetical protein HYALB_00001757 [Hymenoscyphus albidus]
MALLGHRSLFATSPAHMKLDHWTKKVASRLQISKSSEEKKAGARYRVVATAHNDKGPKPGRAAHPIR